MIDWIKFSERKPEKGGDYLYSEDGEFVRVLNWSLADKHFWDPYSEDTSGKPHPEYWAAITPPLVKRSGIAAGFAGGILCRPISDSFFLVVVRE